LHNASTKPRKATLAIGLTEKSIGSLAQRDSRAWQIAIGHGNARAREPAPPTKVGARGRPSRHLKVQLETRRGA